MRVEIDEFTKDAETYGNALNDAGWAVIEAYEQITGEPMSAKLWNANKTLIRVAILAYAASLAKAGAKE